jgi:hypothetical protein
MMMANAKATIQMWNDPIGRSSISSPMLMLCWAMVPSINGKLSGPGDFVAVDRF